MSDKTLPPEMLPKSANAEVVNYFVGDELPRRVSRGRIPIEMKPEFDTIDSVTCLAKVLGCSRQTLYAPGRRQLKEIKYYYRIPDNSECSAEFDAGSFECFRDEYRALHAKFVDESTANPAGEVFVNFRLLVRSKGLIWSGAALIDPRLMMGGAPADPDFLDDAIAKIAAHVLTGAEFDAFCFRYWQ
jgi:hypothetical protein